MLILCIGATLESLIPVPELRSIAEKLVTAETICIKTEVSIDFFS